MPTSTRIFHPADKTFAMVKQGRLRLIPARRPCSGLKTKLQPFLRLYFKDYHFWIVIYPL
jgi:hypothetical protein